MKFEPFQPTEYQDQVVVFSWARLHEHREPRLKLLHASLAGVRLPIGLAKKVKAAGNRAGVPDIALPVSRVDDEGLRQFSGLYLELKRAHGGRLSVDQLWWIDQLQSQRFCCRVAKGAREAIDYIKWYLDFDDGTKGG